MRKNVILIRNASASDFGGGERVPVWIARELLSHGLEPIVFSRSTKLLGFAQAEGVPTKRSWWWAKQNWSGANLLIFPVYILWQLALYVYYVTQFKRRHADVVHIQSKDDFIAATLAARTLGVRVLWSDYADLKHIWLNHKTWYKNPVGKLVYWCARYAEKIIVVSNNDKALILSNIPKRKVADKLLVIYNGVFDDTRVEAKNRAITFVSTARLVTDKGISELIRAFTKLTDSYPEAELSIVGDGPDKDHFLSLAKGRENIVFHGHQTDPLSYLSRSHVFVLPTYHEGFSIALIEACMMGLAVIATDVGGNPEIIDNKINGLLVKPRDMLSLYEAMKMLYEDGNLRKQLGSNARKKYITNFDFSTIIEEHFLPLYNGK